MFSDQGLYANASALTFCEGLTETQLCQLSFGMLKVRPNEAPFVVNPATGFSEGTTKILGRIVDADCAVRMKIKPNPYNSQPCNADNKNWIAEIHLSGTSDDGVGYSVDSYNAGPNGFDIMFKTCVQEQILVTINFPLTRAQFSNIMAGVPSGVPTV